MPVARRLVTLTAEDGEEHDALFEVDERAARARRRLSGRAAAVVHVHGIMGNFLVGTLRFYPAPVARAGFPVLVLETRMSNVGQLFGQAIFEEAVRDVQAAVAWLPDDAQSTQVVRQIEAFQSKNEFPAVIVYEREAGVTAADTQAVAAQVARFNELEPVRNDSVGPIPSEDGKALQVIIPVDAGDGGWDTLGDTVADLRAVADDRPDGLSMHVTGPVGYAADSSEAFSGIDGKLLYSAMAVVIVILLLTYRSPVLWLIPVVSAGTALFVAQAVIYFLAKDDTLTVTGQRERTTQEQGDRFYRFERRHGSFSRAVGLPAGIDEDKVAASYRDGVLEVRVPKPEEAKPRRIQLGAGHADVDASASTS